MGFLKEKFQDKTAVARVVVGTVVGFCVTAVVRQVIENNTEPETALESAQIRVGSIACGLMAADLSSQWTSTIINATVKEWKESQDYVEEIATEEA